MSNAAEQAELFDTYASSYRQVVEQAIAGSGKDLAFFTEAKAHQLEYVGSRLSTPLSGARVLDVGCGAGDLDALLAPKVGHLEGVDVSENMVGAARATNPGVPYQTYDGQNLPFDDDSFDIVFAACVVHHVEPEAWPDFTAELMRVTRVGGAAVVIEHNPLNPLTRRSVTSCPFDEDATLTRPEPLVQLFRRAGACAVRSRYMLFTPFGGKSAQSAERLFLRRVPLGAQYLVEARK